MTLASAYSQHQGIHDLGFNFDADKETFYIAKDFKFTAPEGYEDWKVEVLEQDFYFNQRMKEMGITELENSIEIIGDTKGAEDRVKMPVFSHNRFGDIDILQYSLHRAPYTYMSMGAENTSSSNREEYDIYTRFAPYRAALFGRKSNMLSKTGTHPFWHPSLIEIFESDDAVCETLFITEGQFKAWKASMDGIPTVGLTSITHYRDKKLNSIHKEIIEFIKTCRVKQLVILWDGDCKDISTGALERGEDISVRPGGFYRAVQKMREFIQDYIPAKSLQIYFAHIKSDELKRNNPKGIDDLLIEYADKKTEIVEDFKKIGDSPSNYFEYVNITLEDGMKKMRKLFHLNHQDSFYQFHQEKIGERDFIYFGTTYRVEKGKVYVKIDANVKAYKRIGIDYYRLQKKPVPSGNGKDLIMEEVLEPWSKGTIVDDHGKNVIEHVERFRGFTNIPSHTDFQQHVHGYWNLYYNIQHKLEEGKWDVIEMFLRHIFGEHYEYGLDYMKLLYENPFQKLPILCLVSHENQTGKSTFVYLLKLIFKHNMAIVSGEELVAPFNSSWVSKSLVACEETFLEKKQAMERIKSLSTAKEVMRNEKNKSASSIPCALKFVFCSNNEDNFIQLDDESRRFWVRKVPVIPNRINNFEESLENELPYFLHYLTRREVQYKQQDRMWFRFEDLRTDAFDRVVKQSEPTVIKEIKENMREMFLNHGFDEIKMSVKDIKFSFKLTRFEDNYMNKVLVEYLRLDREKDEKGKDKLIRYQYPCFDPNNEEGFIMMHGHGRPFIFKRVDFIGNYEVTYSNLPPIPSIEVESSKQTELPMAKQDDDLPF